MRKIKKEKGSAGVKYQESKKARKKVNFDKVRSKNASCEESTERNKAQNELAKSKTKTRTKSASEVRQSKSRSRVQVK